MISFNNEKFQAMKSYIVLCIYLLSVHMKNKERKSKAKTEFLLQV